MVFHKTLEVLSKVKGVQCLALGGSRSRAEADEHSDYDIGVYYETDRLDLPALEQALRILDDNHGDHLLNPPGQWGKWINGGAWITVDGVPVDLLLRDIPWVQSVIKDCLAGQITIDYQPGHPFGFVNAVYAAETHYCQPLWQDEAAALTGLKALLHSSGEYPPQMREALMRKFIWEAWFSLACGRKAALKGDLNYAMGSFFRAVCSWIEVLYACNNRYLMNEKGALRHVEGLQQKPIDMEQRVQNAYGLFAVGRAEQAYAIADALHAEVEGLADGIPLFSTNIR